MLILLFGEGSGVSPVFVVPGQFSVQLSGQISGQNLALCGVENLPVIKVQCKRLVQGIHSNL